MPQLDPTWFASQLFWLFVTFVALYVLLSQWALPRVMGVLAQRADTISSDLSRAETLTSEADRARQHYEQTLAEARGKAQDMFSKAMAEHKAKAEQAGKALDAQIQTMLAEADTKISAAKDKLMKDLTPASTELAGMIVEKIAGQTPGKESVQSIVDEAMKRKVSNG